MFLLMTITFSESGSGQTAPVYVTLWFDTEDYILPASDDAALRLAERLSALGIRATYKIVGEKARVLERRGRRDVIAALARHEIGYHTDFHSVHPTPAERLSHAGWNEGHRAFDRAERSGIEDVRRIFGQAASCYGQPGSSWAPQVYPVLRDWGVPVYLDECRHVGMQNKPFYYGGVLNVLNLGPYVTRVGLDESADLDVGRKDFAGLHRRVQQEGGGLVSIFYHPCEFVHREFWDGVNFSRGANPQRGEWRLPAAKTAAETEQAFANFEEYILFVKAQPGVRFVTAREIEELYRDTSPERKIDPGTIRRLARQAQQEITYQSLDGYALSAAEIFGLLNSSLVDLADGRKAPLGKQASFVEGPPRPAAPSGNVREAGWDQLVQTSHDVQSALEKDRQIPAEIWLGSAAISPADYLATIADLLAQPGKPPQRIELRKGNFTAARHVATDELGLWDWPIFPEGFHSPRIMEHAALQAWTLKPAILRKR
jgi:hypothetical protein